MRWFNTAGPNRIACNYMLPVLARLPEVLPLIADNAWFVLHGPRQSGKTTTMMSLAAELRGCSRLNQLGAPIRRVSSEISARRT